MNTILALALLLAVQDAPAAQEADAALWKAVDEGALDKVKEANGDDTKKLADFLKKGRPVPDGAAGETKTKLTDIFDRQTDLWTLVPKTYDKTKPCGVLVVLHGLGGTGAQGKDLFKKFADQNNYIVLAPTAQPEPKDARNEDHMDKPGKDEPKHWWCYRDGNFVFTALADLKRRFAVDENRVVIAGYAMGGMGAVNLGLRYPDRFAAVVSFAGAFARTEFAGLKVDAAQRRIFLNGFSLPFYMVHGDQDAVVPVELERESRNRLKDLGYEHVYVEVPKGKHELNLREEGPIVGAAEKWIKDRVRKPHPKEVKHHALGDYCPQSYWVKITEFSGTAAAEVQAAVKGQTIEFTATGVRKLAFYLDETHLDLEKPVKVVLKGKTAADAKVVFDKKVDPSFDVMLETWRGREDRELFYRAKVAVEIKSP